MNVIARLEFELAYYDVRVQYVSHYTLGTSSARSNGVIVFALSVVVFVEPNYFRNGLRRFTEVFDTRLGMRTVKSHNARLSIAE